MKSHTPPLRTTPPPKTPRAAASARTAQDSDKYIVRFPDGMRDRIAAAAKANNRSMNAEIVKCLEWALNVIGEPTSQPNIPNVTGDIPFTMAQDIARLAIDAEVSFDEMLARTFVAGLHKDAPQVVYIPILPGVTASEIKSVLREAGEFVRPDATIMTELITRWSGVLVPVKANPSDLPVKRVRRTTPT
ncbi:Arc family DNA-binding protein [Janthinobacterium sp. FT14W]|uniref:Arc family DNA-binding protein n=1 Tax=Janthinobacterium sp. FT14W TaxID=2654253 RepID=UPI001265800D|nr:Arc family DNA-binding protein [Janthinobacterium sp. FT14W]KAB8060443.1 Arc family DNA-binding protein [Janthinobacterium sp. FT14W]